MPYSGVCVFGDSLVDPGNALKLAQFYGTLTFSAAIAASACFHRPSAGISSCLLAPMRRHRHVGAAKPNTCP